MRTRDFLLASLLALLVALPASGQDAPDYRWDNLTVGGGGFVSAVIASPAEAGLFYARTDVGGAYRWEDETASWTPLTDWIPESQVGLMGIEALALDPQAPNRLYLLAGTSYWSGGQTAILRSDDYGQTFDVIPTTDQFRAHGNGMGRPNGERLAVDPNDGDVLLAGTRWNGLFTSTDRGDTWRRVEALPVSTTPNENGIAFVVFDPDHVADGRTSRIYVGVSRTGDNLYVSDDAGASWAPVAGGPDGLMPQRAARASDGTLYVTYGNGAGPHGHWAVPEPFDRGGVWRLGAADRAWTNVTPTGITGPFGGISIDPADPDRIVTSTTNVWMDQGGAWGDRLFLSTDGGASWRDLVQSSGITRDPAGYPWIEGHAIHWAGSITFDPFDTRRVFVTSGNGVFMTENVDAPRSIWTFAVDGMEETVPLDLVSIPDGPVLSAIGDYDGFVHADGTQPGTIHRPQMGTTTGIAFAAQQPSFVVRTGSDLYYSTDTGATWRAMNPPDAALRDGKLAVSADGAAVLWAPDGTDMVYRTTTRGGAWEPVGGLAFDDAFPVADRVNADVFYAYHPSSGRFLVSTDGGATFAAAASPGAGGSARIAATPGRAGDVWVPRGDGGLHRTVDAGGSFTQIPAVERATAVGHGRAAPDAGYPTLFLWGRVGGVTGLFRSTDEGASWVRVNDDAHQYGGPGNAQFVVGDANVFGRVYMSTVGRGVVYGTDRSGSATDVEHPAVARASLAPGYPNPFHASTTLRYVLARPAHVRLAVYDVLGRRVAVLVDGVRSAGPHEVHFDAAGLPGGLYLGRLEADGRTHTQRLTLVR